MKKLSAISREQAKQVCKLIGTEFLYFKSGSLAPSDLDLKIEIQTNSVRIMTIYEDGKISVMERYIWGHTEFITINTVPIIDYLRKEGFVFK